MQAKRIQLPNLALSVTVIVWAYNFVAVKHLYERMSPPTASLVRFAIMLPILVVLCLATGRSLRCPKEDWLRINVGGFLSMGLYMVLFLEGMARTSAAEGAIMLATSPILTYLASCLAKIERFSWPSMAGVLVAFLGVVVVIASGGKHGQASTVGNLLVFASAIVWAASVIVLRPALSRMDPVRALTLSMPAALIALVPYGAADLMHANLRGVGPTGWLMMGHVAILSGVVGFAGFYQGIRQVGPSRATQYQYLVAPLTAGFAWLSMGSALSLVQAVGLAIIIVGLVFAAKGRAIASELAKSPR